MLILSEMQEFSPTKLRLNLFGCCWSTCAKKLAAGLSLVHPRKSTLLAPKFKDELP